MNIQGKEHEIEIHTPQEQESGLNVNSEDNQQSLDRWDEQNLL